MAWTSETLESAAYPENAETGMRRGQAPSATATARPAPERSSVGERKRMMRLTCLTQCPSAIEQNGISSFAKTRMQLESVTLNETNTVTPLTDRT